MSILYSDFTDLFLNGTDPRTKDWFLGGQGWPIYTILLAYIYFILSCGPRYMENRKPYDLKSFIQFYNVFQVVSNSWIVYTAIKNGLFTDIGFGCELIDLSPFGKPMNIVLLFYYTLLLKLIDLIETGIFVLRKKQRQVSFLHVYHHISTVYLAYNSVRHYPGGMALFPVALNSGVHVMMYTYYFLSSRGPTIQKIINPFKPYITIVQMAQFFILLGYCSQGLLPSCGVPKWGTLLMLGNLLMNFALFYNFYRQNYKKKPKAS